MGILYVAASDGLVQCWVMGDGINPELYLI